MIKNGLYNSVGAIVRLGLAVASVPILIHFIGVSEYGLWSLISSALMLVTLAEAGLSSSATVFLSKDLSKKDNQGINQTISTIVILMVIFATLAALCLWLIAGDTPKLFIILTDAQSETAINAFRIGAISVWAQLLQQIFVGIGQAFQKYDVLSKINILHSILNYSGLILIAWHGGRSFAFAQWQALENCTILIVYFVFIYLLLKQISFKTSFNHIKSKEIIKFSLKTWLATLGSRLFSQGDRILVGYFLGTSSLGIYSAIINIATLINTFSALPVQPLVPKIAGLLAEEPVNLVNIQKLVKVAFQVNALTSMSLASILVLLSPEAIKLIIPGENIYTLEFIIAITIYSIYSLNAVGYYLSFSMDRVQLTVNYQLAAGIISLFLISIGAINYGLVGAIAGNIGFTLILFLSASLFHSLNINFRKNINSVKTIFLTYLASSITTLIFHEYLYIRIAILTLISCITITYLLQILKERKDAIPSGL